MTRLPLLPLPLKSRSGALRLLSSRQGMSSAQSVCRRRHRRRQATAWQQQQLRQPLQQWPSVPIFAHGPKVMVLACRASGVMLGLSTHNYGTMEMATPQVRCSSSDPAPGVVRGGTPCHPPGSNFGRVAAVAARRVHGSSAPLPRKEVRIMRTRIARRMHRRASNSLPIMDVVLPRVERKLPCALAIGDRLGGRGSWLPTACAFVARRWLSSVHGELAMHSFLQVLAGDRY